MAITISTFFNFIGLLGKFYRNKNIERKISQIFSTWNKSIEKNSTKNLCYSQSFEIIRANNISNIFERIPIGLNNDVNIRRIVGGGIFDEQDDLFRITYEVYIPLIVQIISSCICYYTGRIACKVRRRRRD